MTESGKPAKEEKIKKRLKEAYESPTLEIEGNLRDITAKASKDPV